VVLRGRSEERRRLFHLLGEVAEQGGVHCRPGCVAETSLDFIRRFA